MNGLWMKIKGLLRTDLESDSVSYWKLSSYDRRVQDYSHWCGASTRWDAARWSEYGRRNMRFAMEKTVQSRGPSFLEKARKGIALEWGCGGGANVIALYDYFAGVAGVEIAAPTLDECARQTAARGKAGFRGVLIEAGKPESALSEIGHDSIDFAVSIEVFQHFPSKAYAARVMQTIYTLLKPGAPAWIQVRHDDGSPRLKQKESDYAANMIYMSSFTTDEFRRMAADVGFNILWFGRDEETAGDDHAYYLVEKAFPLTKRSP